MLPSGALYVRDPLFHYLLGATFALPGPDEAAGRVLSLVFSTLAVLGTYVLARDLFGSKPLALGAALLIAVDPYSASYGARVRMYAPLQALTVWTAVFFERDFLRRRPSGGPPSLGGDGNPARSGWRLPALALFAAAFLVHRLAAVLLPALGAVWLAARGWRRGGARWLLPAALLAAGVLLAPRLLTALHEPRGLDAVPGTSLTAPDLSWTERVSYREVLREKLPSRPVSAGRSLLFLGASVLAGWGVLRRRDMREAGLRVCAYAAIPAGLILFYPSLAFFDLRYFMHLLPFAAILLAAGAAAWAPGGARAPGPALVIAAAAAGACFLLVWTPLFRLRYPAFALPLAVGAAPLARAAWHGAVPRDLPALARRAAAALALPAAVVAYALPLSGAALWWTAVLPLAPALRHAAAEHHPRDVVLADNHVPLVAWELGDVDGTIPHPSLNVYAKDGRVLGDFYAGVPPVEDPDRLLALAREARVWLFDYVNPHMGAREAAFRRQRVDPLRRAASEHFGRAVVCRDATLYDSRRPAGATPLGCDLEPSTAAEVP
ncbi:MAG: glycosyltransferase family 39 protein [Gemmatimonadota bacterium]